MARLLKTLPRVDGYRMPGEFEPHDGCWMLFPERRDNWRQGAYPAQQAFAEVAKTISRYEHVTVGASRETYPFARDLLPEHIRVVELSSNDAWMRDVGPLFLKDDQGGLRALDGLFNAWGGLDEGLYFPWDQDDRVARKVAEIERVDVYRLGDFVIEGGYLHVDGQGTCLLTEECLFSKGRHAGKSREEVERVLGDHLNIDRVIWLPRGIYLDETSGHVDNLCAFARPGEVILAWTEDREDPQYERSRAALEVLRQATDARDRSLVIHKLALPSPVIITEEEAAGIYPAENTHPRRAGDRLAASYVNFYMPNGAIVYPTFGLGPSDDEAGATLRRIFPDRDVVGVYSREIILGGGNIHCITMQQPTP
jgi:agmatine deiminase